MSARGIRFLPKIAMQQLIDLLANEGYEVVGPQAKEGAILFHPLDSVEQLPKGNHDHQAPGYYRLKESESVRFFAWANGPQAVKPFLSPPREVIWQAHRSTDGHIAFIQPDTMARKLAILGVRACDLAALKLQDKHFIERNYIDPYYLKRRKNLLLISVNCSHPSDNCFCASTGDGPSVITGYDINLTELDSGFVIEVGSDKGAKLIEALSLQPINPGQQLAMRQQHAQAVARQKRALPKTPLNKLLQANHDHPQWQDIAERCLACGNCTQVCPSCFCHREGDLMTLNDAQTEHIREWDSCFTAEHGYLAGFQVRPDTKSRYRQWMTHKLGTWHEQYGRSGCVGCGRCISWCPAAIDFVEEACKIIGETTS